MNPSLLLIPDRYKTSKLYSQIPDTGAGDLSFTRALDTATRVGADGLIEKVRTNVFRQSQTLATATWQTLTNGAVITKTATAGIAPDGTNTATRIQIGGGGTFSIVFQDSVNPLGSVTISGFFKRFGGTNQTFRFTGNNGNNLSSNLTATNDYQRFSFTYVASSTGADGISADSSNNATDLLVWGMQLETGDIATPYIPTTTAAVSVGMLADIPRIDYTGGGCGKLLLEPQRSNLAFFSENFNNAYWTKTGGTTITANTTISPDGFLNADTIAFAGSGDSINKFTSSGLSVISGTTYTISIFTKTQTQVIFFGGATGGTGTNVFNGSVDFGNGYFRQSITRTWSASGTVNVQFVLSTATAGTSVIAYGCQAELGSYPTSYIPTLGASVTRSADSASKTGISALINSSQGVWYYEFSTVNETLKITSLTDGTSNNFIIFYSLFLGSMRATVGVGGVAEFNFDATITTTNVNKFALRWDNGSYSYFINGVNVSSGTGLGFPSATTLNSFQFTNEAGIFPFEGNVKGMAIYPYALSNSELASLTTL